MNKYTLFVLAMFCLGSSFYFRHQGVESGKIKHKVEEDKHEAYDALHFFNTARAFPNADMPNDGYAKAYSFYKKNFLKQAHNRSGVWENIGPNNIGGRTLTIAIDPIDTNIIWLGSASGGLWKSTTGGTGFEAWTYVPTGFPVLGVSSIAIDPNDHNIMYIGTGETYSYGTSTNGLVDRVERGTFGMGILKSIDGGDTWTMSLDWTYQQNRGIWEMILNPKNTNIIYAATTDGIYKSSDAGGNWNMVLDKKMVMDIEIDKVDTNIVYAGVGNLNTTGKGLYKTSNSGATWNILSNGLPPNTHNGRITITTYAANNKILMAEIADAFSTVGIYRSTNEGLSWTDMNNNFTDVASWQGWYAKGLLMKADDSSKVLAGGVYLFRSDYSGNSLYEIDMSFGVWVHSDYHDIVSNPKDPNKVYLITDGGLYRSDNFGLTFYDCNDGYVTSQAYIGSISATDSGVGLLGCQDNFTSKYYGNPYWQPVYGGDGSFNAINPLDDQHQLASWQYLNIVQSYDQGFSFNPVYEPSSTPQGGNAAAFIAPIIMCPSDPNVVYAGDTMLIRSDDGGFSWLPIGPSPVDNGNKLLTIATSATNPDSLYYATAPSSNQSMHVFRSINGGATNTDITDTLPNRYPRDIAVNPDNSKELYIVFSGFGTGHVYKSTNAGGSWTDVSATLPDVPFHCVTIDPENTQHVFVGSDFGVFSSTDGGNTWMTNLNGIPQTVMVFDLVVSPSDHKLLAFTHGNGVYKIDIEDIFLDVPAALTAKPILTIYPNPTSDFTYIKGMIDGSTVTILNSGGHLVKQITNSGARIDVRGLPNGVYYLRIDKTGALTKLVVLH